MRLLRELRRELLGFIAGQQHGLCVLTGTAESLPYVYRLLHELEAASTDVFLSFPHRFESAHVYVDRIAEQIAASARAARGDPDPPARPDPRDPDASQRLMAALGDARDLLPRGSDSPRLVVLLLPLAMADPRGYLALTRALLTTEVGVPPWFRRMRVFLHAPPDAAAPLPRFARALKVDLSAEALARSAAHDADDPALSREQRAQAQLQAAMLDIGQRRFAAARRRLDALYDEAQALASPVLTALTLSGLGDIDRIERRDGAAIDWYERALAPASAAGAPVVLLMVTRQLADLYFAGGRIAEAELFFDGAQRLAGVVPEPETQATALLGRGLAQQRLGAAPEVWAGSFLAAAEVARDNDRDDLLAGLRPRLAATRGQRLPAALRRAIDLLLGGAA